MAVPGATLASDESIREDTTVDQLSQLRPAFRPDGTVTAGNSSPLNEAFAAESLACLAEWPQLDRSLVNPAGGAIALGHALGCSGARLLTTLAWRLHRRGGGYGLASMCIGVGQGIAVVLEGA